VPVVQFFASGSDFWTVLLHLSAALFAGALIGIERSYHGRPAGFRTHALVCLASSLLMMVTLYQWKWLPGVPMDTVRTDPTRMAQGIMTGIGFLGAGVIFKEGVTVRGLTTAASIWVTAAIGILIGVGFFTPACIATVFTLGTLSVFRWMEARMPSHHYAHHAILFRRDNVMPEQDVRRLLSSLDFTVANMSYRVDENGEFFEYRMIIRTGDPLNHARLAGALAHNPQVHSFRISPTGD
jgi:putative Mg2+ transporter-C (MgtC) family protein